MNDDARGSPPSSVQKAGPTSSATFRGVSPSRIVPTARTLRSSGRNIPLVPGGLFVGAEGRDERGLKYHLVAPLDRGGMGELFIAEVSGPPDTPTHAVVKRLLPDLLDDGDYVEMFKAEAAVMARLDHPNVVKVLGLPELEGTPCLALEFIEGRSAQQLVSRSRRLKSLMPPALAVYVAARVAHALEHVHSARDEGGHELDLVHRDVTPGNVLLGFDGAVKLTDFGIAKSRMSVVSTTVGIVKGKARYLAPEQILGKPASPRSDVFSSALVLFELLSGKPLFERGSIPKTLYAIVHGQHPTLEDGLRPMAKPVIPILERALATEPAGRYERASDLAEALEDLLPELGPAPEAQDLGQYLRGLFTGTRGPLTRALEVPDAPLAATGSAPLDPSHFPSPAPPEFTGVTPLPMLDPVEAREDEEDGGGGPRSRPNEVDEALSVLAWLQRSDVAATPPPEPDPPPRRFGSAFASGLGTGVILAALSAGLAAVWMPGLLRPEAVRPTPVEKAPSPEPSPPPVEGAWVVLPPLPNDLEIGPLPPPPPLVPEPQLPAVLEVKSPRGAKIYLDGRRLNGRAPLQLKPLTAGPHRIEVKKGRYQRVFEVAAQPGETLEIGRNLRRTPPAEAKTPAAPKKP